MVDVTRGMRFTKAKGSVWYPKGEWEGGKRYKSKGVGYIPNRLAGKVGIQ